MFKHASKPLALLHNHTISHMHGGNIETTVTNSNIKCDQWSPMKTWACSQSHLRLFRPWFQRCQPAHKKEIHQTHLAPSADTYMSTKRNWNITHDTCFVFFLMMMCTCCKRAWALDGGRSLNPAVALRITGVLFQTSGGTLLIATLSNSRTVSPALETLHVEHSMFTCRDGLTLNASGTHNLRCVCIRW